MWINFSVSWDILNSTWFHNQNICEQFSRDYCLLSCAMQQIFYKQNFSSPWHWEEIFKIFPQTRNFPVPKRKDENFLVFLTAIAVNCQGRNFLFSWRRDDRENFIFISSQLTQFSSLAHLTIVNFRNHLNNKMMRKICTKSDLSVGWK